MGVVIRAVRDHHAGEELFISYGVLSNPLLFRTYGFTLPAHLEPELTCTFEDSEVLALCRDGGPLLAASADRFAGLPSLHLEATGISRTLAKFLEVCAMPGEKGAVALRELCSRRRAQHERTEPDLLARLERWRQGEDSDV